MESGTDLERAQHESAWTRAKRDANSIYRSTWFGIALTLVGLVATSIAVLFTVGASTATQVAAPLLSGTVAIALTILLVLAVQAAAAPVRQRNELRQHWPITGPVEKPPDVEISIRNYARRGQLLADRVLQMYSPNDTLDADQFAEDVVRFLSTHTSQDVARDFVTSADNVPGGGDMLYGRLMAQVAKLREIAESMSADSN